MLAETQALKSAGTGTPISAEMAGRQPRGARAANTRCVAEKLIRALNRHRNKRHFHCCTEKKPKAKHHAQAKSLTCVKSISNLSGYDLAAGEPVSRREGLALGRPKWHQMSGHYSGISNGLSRASNQSFYSIVELIAVPQRQAK